MQGLTSRVTKPLQVGSRLVCDDNSGAKIVKIFTVYKYKGVKGRIAAAGVGDMVMASVKHGRPDMRKQTVWGVIVRQRRPYRRPDGTRIQFEDNALVVLKDDKGNPK